MRWPKRQDSHTSIRSTSFRPPPSALPHMEKLGLGLFQGGFSAVSPSQNKIPQNGEISGRARQSQSSPFPPPLPLGAGMCDVHDRVRGSCSELGSFDSISPTIVTTAVKILARGMVGCREGSAGRARDILRGYTERKYPLRDPLPPLPHVPTQAPSPNRGQTCVEQ